MKRENLYVVIKRKDILKYLDFGDAAMLHALAGRISDKRNEDNRLDLECVVVESDWPEYEPTWAAIEARVDAETVAEIDNKHYCSDGKWWELTVLSPRSFLIEVGMHDITLESDTFTYRGDAYKQKDRWLTKHHMFCPG